MLVLTACVQRLMYPLVFAPVGLLQRSGMEPRPATFVHFLLLLVLVVLCFFVAPAAVFSAVEMSWTFLDGIYFCFISLCTIGLGDFVPATQPTQKYRSLYQVSVMGECGFYLVSCRSDMYLCSHLFCCSQTTPVITSDAQNIHIVKVIFGLLKLNSKSFTLNSIETGRVRDEMDNVSESVYMCLVCSQIFSDHTKRNFEGKHCFCPCLLTFASDV